MLGQDAGQILVVDAASAQLVRKFDCALPGGLAISPDGKVLYVTCGGPQGSVRFFEAATGQELAAVAVGHTPTGLCVTPEGKQLYVCNRFSNDVSVVDVETKKEVARLPMVREPIDAAASPDGKLVVVANHLPLDRADSFDVACVVNVIHTADHSVQSLRLLNGSTSLRSICVSPDGKYAYTVHLLSRYQLPTTQLERGWMNTNCAQHPRPGGGQAAQHGAAGRR